MKYIYFYPSADALPPYLNDSLSLGGTTHDLVSFSDLTITSNGEILKSRQEIKKNKLSPEELQNKIEKYTGIIIIN